MSYTCCIQEKYSCLIGHVGIPQPLTLPTAAMASIDLRSSMQQANTAVHVLYRRLLRGTGCTYHTQVTGTRCNQFSQPQLLKFHNDCLGSVWEIQCHYSMWLDCAASGKGFEFATLFDIVAQGNAAIVSTSNSLLYRICEISDSLLEFWQKFPFTEISLVMTGDSYRSVDSPRGRGGGDLPIILLLSLLSFSAKKNTMLLL